MTPPRNSGITERRHGRYNIRAGMMDGAVVARAFLVGAAKGHGLVAEATGEEIDEAIEALLAQLDRADSDERGARRQTEHGEVATAAEFRSALRAVEMSEGHRAMLRAHAAAGEKGMTASELAKAAGYEDFSAANLQYGLLGRRLADQIGIALPESVQPGRDDVATAALACAGTPRKDGSFVWLMHPELREALAG